MNFASKHPAVNGGEAAYRATGWKTTGDARGLTPGPYFNDSCGGSWFRLPWTAWPLARIQRLAASASSFAADPRRSRGLSFARVRPPPAVPGPPYHRRPKLDRL